MSRCYFVVAIELLAVSKDLASFFERIIFVPSFNVVVVWEPFFTRIPVLDDSLLGGDLSFPWFLLVLKAIWLSLGTFL
jgi:hypothetical protein